MGARTALEGSPPDPRRRGCPKISPRPMKLRSSSATPGRPFFRRLSDLRAMAWDCARQEELCV